MLLQSLNDPAIKLFCVYKSRRDLLLTKTINMSSDTNKRESRLKLMETRFEPDDIVIDNATYLNSEKDIQLNVHERGYDEDSTIFNQTDLATSKLDQLEADGLIFDEIDGIYPSSSAIESSSNGQFSSDQNETTFELDNRSLDDVKVVKNSILEIARDGQDFLRLISLVTKLKFEKQKDIFWCFRSVFKDELKFSLYADCMQNDPTKALFLGFEQSTYLSRLCFITRRPLKILLKHSGSMRTMLVLERPLDFKFFWQPDSLSVYLPNHDYLGSIESIVGSFHSYRIFESKTSGLEQIYSKISADILVRGPIIDCSSSSCFPINCRRNCTVNYGFYEANSSQEKINFESKVASMEKQDSNCVGSCRIKHNCELEFMKLCSESCDVETLTAEQRTLCLATMLFIDIRRSKSPWFTIITRILILVFVIILLITGHYNG